MKSVQKKSKYTSEAIQDILDRLERINELINLHQTEGDADSLSLKSWKKVKKQLTMQFVGLLNDPNLVISVKHKAA